ncbi:MAG: LCP family protein [Spirochaetia bacterium]|jgi:anionic cell wall polymer biosynthesis LytR-Cps2A-Psr (LCP) family protein|nr:LCP family protein [Spirochaetia bacterium]
MGRSVLDKSVLFLVAIVIMVTGAIVFMVTALRSEPIGEAVKAERIINIAIILERNGKPSATEILMYYPGNARAALLDVPAETGLIIKSLKRVDSIDVLYDASSPGRYLDEIESLTGADIDWYLILDERSLESLADLLDGLSVFLPNRIATVVDETAISLPSGFVVLDGHKTVIYAAYQYPDMPDTDLVAKRQSLYQALLRRLGERSDFIMRSDVYPSIQRQFRTNLKRDSLERLLKEFGRLEADRIVLQRLTGTNRNVEGKLLLFPHYDGELVKDIVKQSLNALLNADETAVADKVFTLEILNGTSVRGLAQKTAEIFQSFGYEVISIGNAPSVDVEKTSVIDRYGDKVAATNAANVIRCNVVEDEAIPSSSPADFVIILGKDFNGRNCVD